MHNSMTNEGDECRIQFEYFSYFLNRISTHHEWTFYFSWMHKYQSIYSHFFCPKLPKVAFALVRLPHLLLQQTGQRKSNYYASHSLFRIDFIRFDGMHFPPSKMLNFFWEFINVKRIKYIFQHIILFIICMCIGLYCIQVNCCYLFLIFTYFCRTAFFE